VVRVSLHARGSESLNPESSGNRDASRVINIYGFLWQRGSDCDPEGEINLGICRLLSDLGQ
jgi:hypothetical protein